MKENERSNDDDGRHYPFRIGSFNSPWRSKYSITLFKS